MFAHTKIEIAGTSEKQNQFNVIFRINVLCVK